MKLVLATPLYPPEAGGPATFAKTLEEELPKHGWAVETIKFADVRYLPKFLRHIAYMRRVKRAARMADVVLALDPVSVGLPACIAAKMVGKPFYVRIAGDYAWEQGVQRFGVKETLDEFVERTKYSLSVRLLRAVQTFVARNAVRVIVPSLYLRHIISRWGIAQEKIIVAYNAAPEIDKAMFARPEVDGAYIVSIARLVPWKGMGAVITAVTGSVESRTLVIIGDGPERGRLEAEARNSKHPQKVIFTGNLPHEETMRYLAHADSFVLDTRYEGLSHLILEALALGTPVATTNAGGNPELVKDGDTGLIFPYENVDAIRECIGRLRPEAELWKVCTANGRALIGGFTKDKMIREVIDALSIPK